MKFKNVVVLESNTDSTYELNNAKKYHQPNWEYHEMMDLIQPKQYLNTLQDWMWLIPKIDLKVQIANGKRL
jgi:hypothetical protein